MSDGVKEALPLKEKLIFYHRSYKENIQTLRQLKSETDVHKQELETAKIKLLDRYNEFHKDQSGLQEIPCRDVPNSIPKLPLLNKRNWHRTVLLSPIKRPVCMSESIETINKPKACSDIEPLPDCTKKPIQVETVQSLEESSRIPSPRMEIVESDIVETPFDMSKSDVSLSSVESKSCHTCGQSLELRMGSGKID